MAQTVADKVELMETDVQGAKVQLAKLEERLTAHDVADQVRHQEAVAALAKVESLLREQFGNLWLLVKILTAIVAVALLGKGADSIVTGIIH